MDGTFFEDCQSGSTSVLDAFVFQYLTTEEKAQICQQFQSNIWSRNDQVLWTGIPRAHAQQWADSRKMQTLTTAMGPLMNPEHPLCLKSRKNAKGWSKYIKGASAVFAWHISRGERVTVLSPPPPDRFHPSGLTNYQEIEEPILKGNLDCSAVLRIEMVHPTLNVAENFSYQIWPADETDRWTAEFGRLPQREPSWREVRKRKAR